MPDRAAPPDLLVTDHGTVVDPREYTDEDLRRTVAALDALWDQVTDGEESAVRSEHERLVRGFAGQIGRVGADLAGVSAALAEHGRLKAFFPVRGPSEAFVRAELRLLLSAGADARARRTRTGPATGMVDQLSVSAGGVPKLPVPEAAVGWRGLDGDRQGSRIHHGRAWQAVSLWSAEVIDAFAAAGHPIAPGRAGENVTVRGLDWADVRPGARLQVGASLLECSAYAIPCTKNAPWFLNGEIGLMHHDRGPGVSRVYAHVLVPGLVKAGDPVRLVD